jgi:hypothetical protein
MLQIILFIAETVQYLLPSHPLSLALREEHRSKMFENRVLRRIFGHKREEVAGGWRRLHNEELHNFSSIIIRVIKSRLRWVWECSMHGRDEKCIQ